MALPTLTYSTWRFKVNQDLNTTGNYVDDFKQLLLAIKNALISSSGWTDSAGSAATVSSPWTVVASSNGTVADTSDNWNSSADLVWSSSGAHSWIVLRQTGVNGGNLEWCIDLNHNSAYLMTTVGSAYNGFDVSSPTTAARPTATDEHDYITTSVTWINGGSTFNCALHVMMTSGGECTRILAHVGGVTKTFMGMEKPSPVSGWSNSAVFYYSPSDGITYTKHNDTTTYARCCVNGVHYAAHFSSIAYSSNMLGQLITVANDITGEWPMIPIGLAVDESIPFGGWAGRLSDFWWGSTGVADGDTYPASGTLNQFLHTGNAIIPWNQSTPLLT